MLDVQWSSKRGCNATGSNNTCAMTVHLSPIIHGAVQETTRIFTPVMGDVTCEPSNIHTAATVDQDGNIIKAFENMGVPVLLCAAHRLNSMVGWGVGTNGTSSAGGTCKNRTMAGLFSRAAAMVGKFSHSPKNNNKLQEIQRRRNGPNSVLELIGRNDTRCRALVLESLVDHTGSFHLCAARLAPWNCPFIDMNCPLR